MSKINHLLIAIPSPPQNVLKNLQLLFFNFIWNSRRDKIKRKVSIKDYHEGGLRIIDIFSFNDSLKATWIRRLLNMGFKKWVTLLEVQWSDYYKFVNFGEDYIKRNLHKLNPFWKDVFRAFSSLSSNINVVTVEQFLNQPVWFNKCIKIAGKSIFNISMFNSGVRTINDLIDDEGQFLTFEQYGANSNVNVNFIVYRGIIAAIGQYKREKLQFLPDIQHKLQAPNIPEIIRIITKDKKGCRNIYKHISWNNEVPTSIAKWENEFRHTFEQSQWNKIFKLPFTLTTSTTSRWFQIRLLHRILGTNTFLSKIGVRQDNTCSFCTDEPETLTHLFCSCPIVTLFWNNIFRWIKDKCVHICTLQPTRDEIIMGIIVRCSTIVYKLLTTK